jgi:hypothetical protein
MRQVRPLRKMLRALGTTIMTLAVLGGIAYGGYRAADGKVLQEGKRVLKKGESALKQVRRSAHALTDPSRASKL